MPTVAAHSPPQTAPNEACARLRFELRRLTPHATTESTIRPPHPSEHRVIISVSGHREEAAIPDQAATSTSPAISVLQGDRRSHQTAATGAAGMHPRHEARTGLAD